MRRRSSSGSAAAPFDDSQHLSRELSVVECVSSTLHERPARCLDATGLRAAWLVGRLMGDFEAGDPLPQLQRVGMLETPILQAFRWHPPEIVAKTVVEVSSRFNKLQHPIFVSY